MITKYSSLQKQSGKIKEKLLDMYEKQVAPKDRDDTSFESWYENLPSDAFVAGYTDVPVKTWDKLYHEESQPYDLDMNLRGVPETTGKKAASEFETRINKDDTFSITYLDGSEITGYIKNQDFYNERRKPTRGEIFWVKANTPGKNIGLRLAVKALELMKRHGTLTVNINAVSPAGRKMVESLIRKRYISAPIQESPTGKKEYEIS